MNIYGKIYHPDYYYINRDNEPPMPMEYTIDNPAPTMISIYDGIHQKKSTRSDIFYPTLRHLGNINITERKFYKGQHFNNKIIQQNDDSVILFNYRNQPENYTYIYLGILCRQMAYTDDFFNKMIDTIIRTTYNNKIHSRNDGIEF